MSNKQGNRHRTPTSGDDQQDTPQDENTKRLPEIGVYLLALKSLILTHPMEAIALGVVLSISLTLVYAWEINPVTYYGSTYSDLSVEDQRDVIEAMATDVLFDESKPRIVEMARRFPDITVTACAMADEELRRGDAMNGKRVERLWLLVYEITGEGQCQISNRR